MYFLSYIWIRFSLLVLWSEKGWLIFYRGKGQDCLSSPIFPEGWCFHKVPDPDYSKHFPVLSVLSVQV